MKQKTGRKLLAFLLTLAMVVGLFPGMSLTAYAATSHGITINTAQHGTVTASVNGSAATSAEENETVTLTATPDAGYKLKSISATYTVSETLNGSSNNNTVTGTYFKVSGANLDDGGWRVGTITGCTLTISSLSNKNISKVVLTVKGSTGQRNTSHLRTDHGSISASGTAAGSTVTVTGIDSPSVTLSAPEANNNTKKWIFSPIEIDGLASIAPDLNDTENENVKTFTMSSSNVTITAEFEEMPKYSVTYKVVGGTWSDGTTADKTETVASGSKPASVPTGMKASQGFTGGAWDENPADATITGAKTFTYTFTAKQASTVTKAPTAKNLTYTGSAQELVTAGEATGGEMQYTLGTATEATQPYTTSIPTATNAGT